MNTPSAPSAVKEKKKKTTPRKKYSAPALEKGLDILELIADEAEGLKLSEIATKLNRSVGEVFRMIAVLEQRGYLSLTANSEQYSLTFKMFDLSHRHAPLKRLTAATIPVIQRLTRTLEQSCHLSVIYNGRGLVIAQKESPSRSGFNVRLGSEFQILQSCSGHVILAFSDENSRSHIMSEISAKELREIPKPKLKADLNRIAEKGYECMDSTVTFGMKDIGFPIFNHMNEVVASLTIPFLERIDGSQKVPLDGAIEQLAAASDEISKALGYKG